MTDLTSALETWGVGTSGRPARSVLVDQFGNAVTYSGPSPVGGSYLASPPLLVDGTRQELRLDSYGGVMARLAGNTTKRIFSSVPNNDAYVVTSGSDEHLWTNSAEHRVNSKIGNGAITRRRHPSQVTRILSAGSGTNLAFLGAGTIQLFRVRGRVARASSVFMKIYDKATSATVGTDTPVMTIELLQSAPYDIDLCGFQVAAGCTVAFTTAASDGDTGALTAGDIVNHFLMWG